MKVLQSYLGFAALAAALSVSGCHSKSSDNQAGTGQNNPNNAQQAPGDNGPQQYAGNSGAQQSPGARRTQPGNRASNQPPRNTTPPPPAVINLPEGTQVRVRLDDTLSSKDSQPGQTFSATVADDVEANGTVVIPKGARAKGTVVDSKGLGRFKGGAMLAVKLDTVHTRWGSYPVETSSISRAEQGKGKRSTAMIGGGAGLGALIGGLAGGGKGAAIGALAGGGAGTAGTAFTGNKQIVLPAETLLTFRLTHPVRITESGRGEPETDESGDPNQDPQLKTR